MKNLLHPISSIYDIRKTIYDIRYTIYDLLLFTISALLRFAKYPYLIQQASYKINQKGVMKLSKNVITTYLIIFFAFSTIAGLFLFNPFGTKETEAAWFNDNWQFRKILTIDDAQVAGSSNLTDFPVLISLSADSSLSANAQSDGDDIIFTDQGGNILDHDLESYSAGTLVAWVRIPSLSPTTDTPVHMYYGNASVSAMEYPAGVWKSSYAAVWHLNETSGTTIEDSTSNNNVAAKVGATEPAVYSSGKIGTAQDFDGVNDKITKTGLITGTTMTVSGWAQLDNADTEGAELISIGDYVTLRLDDPGVGRGTIGSYHTGGGAWGDTETDTLYEGTGWHYFTYVVNPGSTSQVVYVDGVSEATDASGAAIDFTTQGSNTLIGAHGNGGTTDDFDGQIDEVRVATTSRTVDWVLTEFNNQNSPSTFFATGSEEKGPTPALYWKFDDGTGTIAQDSTASNRDGATGVSTWKPEDLCVSGKCLYFDGTAAASSAGAGGSADVTIDNDVETATGDLAYIISHKMGIVWTSNLVGYAVFAGGNANNDRADLSYRKTTDGGQTWGSEVAVTSKEITRMAIWYDKETPGDTGTKIHIVYTDFNNDDLIYRTLDTSNDSLSSEITMDSSYIAVSLATHGSYFGGGYLSITKSRGGNIYVFGSTGDFSGSGSAKAAFYRSIDGGSNWTSRSTTNLWTGDFNDLVQIVPAGDTDNQDIAAIWHEGDDVTSNQIRFRLYDDSGNTWGTDTLIDNTNMLAGDWPDDYWGFDVAIRHSDNKAILAYWTHENNAAADLKVAELTLTAAGAASSAKTDVLTNSTGSGETAVFIDNNSNDIYVSYLSGTNWDAAGAAINVSYKKSTDGGSNWGSAVQVNTTSDDYRGLSTVSGIQSGQSGRFMPIWPDEDDGDLITNYADSVSITSGSDVKLASTVGGVRSVSFWVKPSAFTSTTPLVDLNGTAKITTNSSGVLSAGGFTSPTIYVNGQVGTAISANTWSFVTVTTGTDISASAIKVASDGTNALVGFADEVKMYNFALSADQVKTNYNARSSVDAVSMRQGGDAQNMPNALSNGLVGYWKADESSGDAADSSGNTGTLTNTATTTYTAAKFSNGAEMNGTTQYLSRADTTPLSVTGSLTLAAWIEPDDVSGSEDIIAKWDGSNESYLLAKEAGEVRMYIDSASNYQATTGTPLAANTKAHVVGVYNASNATVKIYVNGSEAASSTTGTIPSSIGDDAGKFHLGAEDSTTTAANFFDGHIDEARVYNRALSGAEVSQLYNWAPGPILSYELEEGSGTTAKDTTGTGNDGTITAGTGGYTIGKQGKGYNFDGSTTSISKTDNNTLDLTSFTLESWVYFNAIPSGGTADFIMSKGNATDDNYWIEWTETYDTPNNSWVCGSYDGDLDVGQDVSYTATPTVNTWYHIACTFDDASNTMRLYLNGALVGINTSATVDPTTFTNNGALSIGVARDVLGEPLNGRLDGVKIFNYARTPSQIAEDLNSGHPAPGSPVGTPVAHWKFDEGFSTTAYDSSSGNGGAENLTLNTFAWTNSGKFGRAWNGDGSLLYANTAADDDDLDFNATDSFTLSMWYKTDSASNPGAIEYLAQKMTFSGTEQGYAVYANTSGNLCFGIDDDTTFNPDVASCTSTDFYDATWHYLTAVRNTTADTTSIYIDGILRDSDTDTTTATLANSKNFAIGELDGADNGSEFAGDLDELKIYRSALTADQIKLDMNQGSGQVMGALSNNAAAQSGSTNTSATQEYCIPGDTTTCTGPVALFKMETGTGLNQIHADTSGSNLTTGLGGDQTMSRVTGKFGKGVYFPDDNEWLSVTDNAVIRPGNGSWTMMGWGKSPNNDQHSVFFSKNSVGNEGYYMSLSGNTGTNTGQLLYAAIAESALIYRSAYTNVDVVDGNWHHYAAVADKNADRIYLYVDGVLVSQTTGSNGVWPTIDNTDNLNLSSVTGGSFDGTLDELRIYNYARTPAQIVWDARRGAPIAHWKMDECQGTTINDSAGNSLSGTLTNATAGTCTTSGSWFNGVTGKRSYSMDFDGSDDHIAVSDNDKISIDSGLATGFTFSTWVYPNSDGETDVGEIFDKGTNTFCRTNSESGSRVTITCRVDLTTDADFSATTTIPINTWSHVAFSWTNDSDDEVTIWINGVPQSSSAAFAGDGAADANALTIGGTPNYDGQIDDFRIYNYELTTPQIKALINDGVARYGPVTGAP